jgi:hypothetical protein
VIASVAGVCPERAKDGFSRATKQLGNLELPPGNRIALGDGRVICRDTRRSRCDEDCMNPHTELGRSRSYL